MVKSGAQVRSAAPTRSPAESTLDRRYRRLLIAYPAEYRVARGDEIVGTLLDVAPPGRRWPDLGDAIDVVGAGLRRRFGPASLAGLDGGLALAAPMALALAAGIAGFAWWRVEPMTVGVHIGGSPLFGQFRTLGPIGYAGWVLAAVGWAVLRPPWSRLLVAAAVLLTLALPVVAPLTTVDRPPLWVILALTVFGLITLAGSGPSSGVARSPLDSRLAVPAGAFAVAVATSAVTLLWAPSGAGFGYYYQPTIARVGLVVAAVVGVVAAIAVTRQVRRRGAVEWLWATALLGLPAGWLGPFDTGGLRVAAADPVPHFGRLAQLVLASCIGAVTIAWLARRRTTGASAVDGLPRAGAFALGMAAGLGLFLAAALTITRGPGHVVAAIAVLAAAGLLGRPRSLSLVLGSTGLTLVLAWLVAVYDNGWTVRGWADPAHTASLVVTIALLPLSACAYTAARSLASTGTRPATVLVLALSLGWIGYSALPYVLSWGPVLFVLVICGVAVTVPRRHR
jgi:hypothetical protein